MKIAVQHIPSQGVAVDVRREMDAFEGLQKLAAEENIDFLTPLNIKLAVHAEKEMIKVHGRLTFTLRMACSRCLADFDSRVKHDFTLGYSREIPQDVNLDGPDSMELTAEEIGLIYYQGDEIDLTDVIREQVILSLPYRRLCASDCKGLCPVCGANLNREACQCDQRRVPGPFDILKTLK